MVKGSQVIDAAQVRLAAAQEAQRESPISRLQKRIAQRIIGNVEVVIGQVKLFARHPLSGDEFNFLVHNALTALRFTYDVFYDANMRLPTFAHHPQTLIQKSVPPNHVSA